MSEKKAWKEIKSVKLLLEQAPDFENATDEEIGYAIRAVLAYMAVGEVPAMTGQVLHLFKMIAFENSNKWFVEGLK